MTGSNVDHVALTKRIGVVDGHNDLPMGLTRRREQGVTGTLRTDWLPGMRAGGMQAVVCAVYIDSVFLPESALRRAVQMVDALLEEIALCDGEAVLATTAAEVRAANAAGKIALLLAFEGAEPLGTDLSALRLFHRLGLRMLSFTWMRRTAFGDGTWENDTRGGLSRLGRQAVAEMNRLGIVPDVSHASDQTTWDVLETSTRPVIASHSNARALCDHPRNVTNEMIRAIAASGGFVGAVAVSRFITDGAPTISRFADHIDHLVQTAGIDHVGIGADFFDTLAKMNVMIEIPAQNPLPAGPTQPFSALLGPEGFPNLTEELLCRGYADDQIARIYAGNFLRVLEQTAG